MGFQIMDGSGTGRLATVRSDGQLLSYVVSESPLHYRATQGLSFMWQSTNYSYNAGDTILWIRNDSSTRELIIDGIYLYSNSPSGTEAILHFPTGTSPAGTLITGVNWNRGSGRTANVTAYSDETGNTQGTVFRIIYIPQGAPGREIDLMQSLILNTNDEFAIDFVSAGTACSVAFWGFQRIEGEE